MAVEEKSSPNGGLWLVLAYMQTAKPDRGILSFYGHFVGKPKLVELPAEIAAHPQGVD